MQRAGYVPRLERARNRRSHVDDERTLSHVHEAVQLVDADPRHAEHRIEAVPFPPFERDVCRHQGADEKDCRGAVILEIFEEPLDLRPEQHPAAHTGGHPQRSARGIEEEERQPADARRARERRRKQRNAGNKLRNEEHIATPELEPRLRLTHA